jgi:hypothetical protein
VLDSNVYRNDYSLAGPEFAELFAFLEKSQFILIIPSIVLEELKARFMEDCAKRLAAYRSASDNLRAVVGQPHATIPRLDFAAETEKFISRLTSGRPRVRTLVEDFSRLNLGEVVNRGVWRKRPADASGEQLRDVAIWLGTLELAKRDRVAFISGDKKAFRKDAKESFLDGENLHQDLKEEVERQKVELDFYPNIGSFLLRQSLSWSKVNHQAWKQLVPESSVFDAIEQAAKEAQPEIDNISGYVFRDGVRNKIDANSTLMRVEYKGLGQPANPPMSRMHNIHTAIQEEGDEQKPDFAAWVDYVEIPFKVWVSARLVNEKLEDWRVERLQFPDRDELFAEEIVEYYVNRISPLIEAGESEAAIRSRFPRTCDYLDFRNAFPKSLKRRPIIDPLGK